MCDFNMYDYLGLINLTRLFCRGDRMQCATHLATFVDRSAWLCQCSQYPTHVYNAKNSSPNCFFNALYLLDVQILSDKKIQISDAYLYFLVEATGFEPAAFASRTQRATKLRYASFYIVI